MLFSKSSTLISNGDIFWPTIGRHFMWFQKADLDESNKRLLLYSILQS